MRTALCSAPYKHLKGSSCLRKPTNELKADPVKDIGATSWALQHVQVRYPAPRVKSKGACRWAGRLLQWAVITT